MNRDYAFKSGFMLGTLLFAGFVSWLTHWDFGAVWCVIAVATTDLMLLRKFIVTAAVDCAGSITVVIYARFLNEVRK